MPCCLANEYNLVPRLRGFVLMCVANDCIGLFFYAISALWGHSRPGLATTDLHECYIREGYYGHFLGGISALISTVGCILGAAVGSHVFCMTTQASPMTRPLFLACFCVFSFELFWMWIAYAVEVFIGYTLPLKECHPEQVKTMLDQGLDKAIISVFYLWCWAFSCAMRATVTYYTFEILYGKHYQYTVSPFGDRPICVAQGAAQVVGVPLGGRGGSPGSRNRISTVSTAASLSGAQVFVGERQSEISAHGDNVPLRGNMETAGGQHSEVSMGMPVVSAASATLGGADTPGRGAESSPAALTPVRLQHGATMGAMMSTSSVTSSPEIRKAQSELMV